MFHSHPKSQEALNDQNHLNDPQSRRIRDIQAGASALIEMQARPDRATV